MRIRNWNEVRSCVALQTIQNQDCAKLIEKGLILQTDSDKKENERELKAKSNQRKLMYWCQRPRYLLFSKLKVLVSIGILPRHLLKAKTSQCVTCLYRLMTKKPQRIKEDGNQRAMYLATYLGEYILIDTIESRTQGFVAQLKEKLTRKRQKHATTFKDYLPDLIYAHLHQENDRESIL